MPETAQKWRESGQTEHALAYLFLQWRTFVLMGDEGGLRKAEHKVLTAFEACTSSALLCLATIFVHLHADRLETAADLLRRLNGYKNFYKVSDPDVFLLMHYLAAVLSLKEGKFKGMQKFHNLVRADAAEVNTYAGLADVLLGCLYADAAQPEKALSAFKRATDAGRRESFMFARLYTLFADSRGDIAVGYEPLLRRCLAWAVRHGADVAPLVGRYAKSIIFGANGDLDRLKIIADAYPQDFLLEALCDNLLQLFDTSAYALSVYQKAQHKQMALPGLNITFVHAAYAHGEEMLSRYAAAEFLAAQSEKTQVGLWAFVYHVILCGGDHFEDLVQQHSADILYFAAYAVESGLRGRHVNSIFAYALTASDAAGTLDEGYLSRIEKLLEPQLFVAELQIENPDVTHVWVGQTERTDMRFYTISEGRAMVSVCADEAEVVCFSESKMQFVPSRVKQCKMVTNGTTDLYLHFYRKNNGLADTRLLIALARQLTKHDAPVSEAVEILSDALKIPTLSSGFAAKISAALGSRLVSQNRYDKALAYYDGVDDNHLNDKTIEEMLRVFLSMDEVEKAAALITKKAHCIPDRVLFQALKQLAQDAKAAMLIADAAYALLIKSWYDKALLALVLKHYNGCQADWQALSCALDAVSAAEKDLDEIIIRNSVWMHKFDEGTQSVFYRMYIHDPQNEHITLFAHYCLYEIMINRTKPAYETISILEKIALETHEPLFAYALCCVYLRHTITTFHSDEIMASTLSLLETEGELLPVFKESKDKRCRTPYIMKHTPFLYRCAPGRQVTLHYHVGENRYTHPMRYLRFGLYTATVPHFYGETLTTYFSEETSSGSVQTKTQTVVNESVYVDESPELLQKDDFFAINNALAYARMFKYEKAEAVISDLLTEAQAVRGCLL